jgi:mannose-6-phosphate isomerase
MQLLTNTVRDYAWGSPTGIPEILGREPDGTPAAELWVGAHHGAPSQIDDTGLDAWIAQAPADRLGQSSVAAFGERLPFLLKILSAETALSIQAHPTLEQARTGFEQESSTGVPLDAPHRNYKDAWHKPELIHALSDFSALCGFRSIPAVLATVARFESVADDPDRALLREWQQTLERPEESEALRAATSLVLGRADEFGPLADRLAALDVPEAPAGDPSLVGSAVDPVETLRQVNRDFPSDAGALVALMLNRIRLRAGESMALDAGVLHAYLGGLGVEIMASSDNVMRGGLTSKHIDLAELDQVVKFESGEPHLVSADDRGVLRGVTEDFALQRIDDAADLPVARSGAVVLLCIGGAYRVSAGSQTLELGSGDAVFIGADEPQPFVSGSGALFAATTGLPPDE